jgi:L-asparaginase
MKRHTSSCLLAVVFLFANSLTFAADKPGVTIYATGGTIAGTAKSATETTGYL